jgi:hypothetical protein
MISVRILARFRRQGWHAHFMKLQSMLPLSSLRIGFGSGRRMNGLRAGAKINLGGTGGRDF